MSISFKSIVYLFFFLFPIYTFSQKTSSKNEFRAAWVATVSNIDWPSKPGLSVEEQKKEIIEILDLAKGLNLNAIILQVRPASDAFYNSYYEPWSRYLTGIPGQAPDPFYDPLEFWIEECHKRGMELHAWFNPFRINQNYQEPIAGNHIAFENPEWVIKYGNKLYFDPGIPETRNFVKKVVSDVVSRYDVDAIHFDDYFYPYPSEEMFPDSASFRKYHGTYTQDTKNDWRRENINTLIKQLNDTIKSIKPWVKFGISPFGVWRNNTVDTLGSPTNAGITCYDNLYADVIKWQEQGWIDYLIPQIYWRVGHPDVDFATLAEWWGQYAFGRGLYIGHGIYKIDSLSEIPQWKDPKQMPEQIKITREVSSIQGSAFYSINHLKRSLFGFQDSLQTNLYKTLAIIPPMSWLDSIPPIIPVKFKKSGRKIKWKITESEDESNKPVRFIIYLNEQGKDFNPDMIYDICLEDKYKLPRINQKKKKYEVRITALDRLNNESLPTEPVIVKM